MSYVVEALPVARHGSGTNGGSVVAHGGAPAISGHVKLGRAWLQLEGDLAEI